MHRANKLALLIFIIALGFAIKPAYLLGKAYFAQLLLQHAWQHQQAYQKSPPWYWADTYPVAKLSFIKNTNEVEHHHQDNKALYENDNIIASWIILAGMHLRNMAFAPAWLQASALPNTYGNTVIAAHNDSHFNILATAALGDRFMLENKQGIKQSYRIEDIVITDQAQTWPYQYHDRQMLTLITCYPFHNTVENKSQRMIIQAFAIDML